ncbi:PAS domain S-box protein [Thiovibrio sp. JS02]
MTDTIFPALIQNAALLLAMAYVYDLLTSRRRFGISLCVQISVGLALGLLGIIIMLSSWRYVPGIVFDTRSVLLSVAGLFFGMIPTGIAMFLTAAFRFYLGGAAVWTGVGVILATGALGIVWRHFRPRDLADISWQELYLFGILVHLLMLALMFTLPWQTALEVLARISLPVLLIYPLATALLGALMVNRLRREQVAARLRAGEERMRLFFERQIVGMAITLPDKGWLQVNDQLCRMLGYSREELVGMAWPQLTHPDDLQADLRQFDRLLSGLIDEYSLEKRYLRKDGTILWADLSVGCVRLPDGRVDYVLALLADITERKLAEEALRESEERYRTLVNNIPGLAYRCLNDEHWTMLFCSDEIERMAGYPAADFIANAVRSYASIIFPEDRLSVERAVREGLAARRAFAVEYRLLRADGKVIWAHEKGRGMYDEKGTLLWRDGVVLDISKRREAEEENKKLQSQLLQAQKMESVGRLAGGVAHDFNNMLQTILGYTDLSLVAVDSGSPLHENLVEIRKAAKRSADLTRQLLAFARKQTVTPRVLDLNDTVSGMLKMLQRLIGENIELVWMPGHELWPVRVDPSQIDQILANLAVNARDAIAANGRITIATENVVIDERYCRDNEGFAPGEYVLLAVSDDGCGMDQDILPYIFEPFFTTKELGKGTGLGLATIYGAVKQNNGCIRIDSKPGQGTAVAIYLPRFHSRPVARRREEDRMEEPPGGVETVLLVEDEEAILKLGKSILEGLGYTVLVATSPGEAIRLADEYAGDIHLLLTDVVMPEMNGRDLVELLSARRKNLRALYMSGYTADVIASHGVLAEGLCFVAKPFSVRELALKVREALAEKE